ncbi:MAG: carbohydrate ABC transporter permease [Caldilineaceae bacterium]|nr:carbohydrate ABC transporter permease [Caldilineaceae bacterium]
MAVKTQRAAAVSRIRITDILVNLLLLLIGITIALPIMIALLTSFKIPSQIITFPPSVLPKVWTYQNYVVAWNLNPFGRFLLNSTIQSGIITLAQVIFSIMAAYAFAILVFPGRNLLFYLVIGSLMVPFELVFIPNYQLISSLNWGDTYLGLTAPFLASAFGVFLLRQFFLTVPKDFHDAARIDGCGNWRYLWTILVPLSKGSIGAFAIFAFLSAWNQYLWPLIITKSVEMRTLQIGIRYFMTTLDRGADWGPVMAGAVIAIFPALVVFLFAQKQLVKGIAMTGLKG